MGMASHCEERHSPLTASILEPALLVLLKAQPRHGYTLLSDLASLGLNLLHPSVVYRALREMEDLEWVQSGWDTDQTQGPPRRVYRLTTQGEEALRNWQEELQRMQELIGRLLALSQS
ncbi:predicted transcriptional regulators [Anaerolinea thermolimosa]|uniref:PadR family transcriptional regulator n=1 Tax=Anaerolinea thermolimosa TaxID=229919 RepID=UPI0007847938|nr:helix-turn-helix transcriptional regulator [Anaerolinea thermolimosa]GAP06453.1 predicted transcriptional regulators [Anaerolinea thermolimosa]